MKDFYFEVLERLYSVGIGVEKEITDIFKDVVNKPWHDKEIQVKDFLEYMRTSGHIKYTIGYTGVPDKDTLNAEITILGYEYYRKHLLETSTIKSIKNQIVYNLVTWFIAIVSIIFTIYVAIKNNDLSNRITALENQQKLSLNQQH